MLLLSAKTNNKILPTDERTDGWVVCKIVFSITYNVSFWCSKEPSHREDSFEHQICLFENIIHCSRFTHIYPTYIKTNIKTKP